MLGFIKKIKIKKHPPEDSINFRVFVLLTILTAVISVLHQQEWPLTGIAVIALTIVGFVFSYINRNNNNIVLKILLALFMLLSLFQFLRDLRLNPYDPRIPLANLLLWLQTLHSYDLPSRRDLNYSLMVGLILIGVASVLTINYNIIIYFILFSIFGTISLMYSGLSKFNIDNDEKKSLNLSFVGSKLVYVLSILIAVTLILFLFIPRFESLAFRPLPRSWVINLPRLSRGKIVNPGQKSSKEIKGKPAKNLVWNPDSYFGFNSYVNLNFRGELSNVEVMKVQSNRWSYIRGLAFDIYDGRGWEITGEDKQDFNEIKSRTPPFALSINPNIRFHWRDSQRVVQIFHIRREMPNIIFGAYDINTIYFPANEIYQDKNGGLRSPYPLEKGMVYSTVSRHIPLNQKQILNIEKKHKYLKFTSKLYGRKYFKRYPGAYYRYTKLPRALPKRVRSLTKMILLKAGAENSSDLRKTLILTSYLKNNYPYDLKIPSFPENCDSVDYFLFQQRRGYCEHFASSLAVMLRTQGIPTRMIFGYLPGKYNLFSGLYTVKQSDAHAWVEVYIPYFGWLPVDPTPGSAQSTFSASRNQDKWLFLSLIKKMKNWVKSGKFPVKLVLGIIILVTFIYIIALAFLRYRKETASLEKGRKPFFKWLIHKSKKVLNKIKVPYFKYKLKKNQHEAVVIYKDMLKELKKKGFKKKSSMTAREFIDLLVPDDFKEDAKNLVLAFETARYGKVPPSSIDIEDLHKTWGRLKKRINNIKLNYLFN